LKQLAVSKATLGSTVSERDIRCEFEVTCGEEGESWFYDIRDKGQGKDVEVYTHFCLGLSL